MPKTVFGGEHRHLVEVLVDARRKAGLTQAELAARLGKDQTFISIIERGQRRVDVLEFIALARALDISPTKTFEAVVARLPVQFKL